MVAELVWASPGDVFFEQPPVPIFSAFCHFRKNAEVEIFRDFLEKSEPYFNKSRSSNLVSGPLLLIVESV